MGEHNKKRLLFIVNSKTFTFLFCLFIVNVLIFSSIANITYYKSANGDYIKYNYSDISNAHIGDPKGVNPGRVVWVWNPNVTEKNLTGYWWYSENIDQVIIDKMFSEGLTNLTDTINDSDAWENLFKYFNRVHNKGDRGYKTGEKISIKINLANNEYNSYDNEDNNFDANPYVVKALLKQLVLKAGVSQEDIIVFDASTPMQDWFYNSVASEYPNVSYVDLYGEREGRKKIKSSDTCVYFAWGPCRNRTLPTCVVDSDYIINMPLLKRHPIMNGVTLAGKNFFGCFIEEVSPLHLYMQWGSIMGNPAPQTDLLAHKDLGKKTLLSVGDGTFATRENIQVIGRFYMYPFDDDWTNSLFFSQDSVALDSVMYDFLRVEGTHPSKGSHNYLHEAANPPKNVYDPENDGIFLSESLGVHEHCDDSVDVFSKNRYSGRIGNGIDYVPLGEKYAFLSVDILKPMRKSLYVFGYMIKPLRKHNTTVVVGKIMVTAKVNGINGSVDRVEFYFDNTLKNIDYDEPYEWLWKTSSFMKLSTIEVKAFKGDNWVSEEISVWKFF